MGPGMKTIMVGGCAPEKVFALTDPDAPLEIEIEAAAVKALSCMYPNHRCVVFTGSFEHEGRVHQPDLALVARDFSHWFVIEIELLSHSFYGHVLPQVTAFRYGTPLSDCSMILQRELGIDLGRAETLVRYVPRSVVVIANRRDYEWETSLAAHYIQFASVSTYKTATGQEAVEFDGSLQVTAQNLGFGSYSATDRALRFPATVALPNGIVQLHDADGAVGTWQVTRDDRVAWIVKEIGTPSIMDGDSVQLVLTYDGRIALKPTRR